MRNLNEILVEMKALVEELESHVDKSKEQIKESDFYFASMDSTGDSYVFTGAMDDTISFNFTEAQPTLCVNDSISLSEINMNTR